MVDLPLRNTHPGRVHALTSRRETRGSTAGGYELPWERVAAETRWGAYVNAIEMQVVEKGKAAAAGPWTVLDVGCEGGRWSKPLADAGWQVTGTDVSQEAVDTFRRRLPNATGMVVRPNTTTLPSPTASVGLLFCLEVFAVVH
ncbi:MAG TPA: methyltransferase domain-containing protein, partial [Acidimicrobiia bacterium]|nr:methyltransferase domain-containing protein [Acidimicrobiia bacterium]